MAIKYTKKSGKKFFNKLTRGHKVKFVYDKSVVKITEDDDYMTDAKKAELVKRLIKLYKRNNIPLPYILLDPTGARL